MHHKIRKSRLDTLSIVAPLSIALGLEDALVKFSDPRMPKANATIMTIWSGLRSFGREVFAIAAL